MLFLGFDLIMTSNWNCCSDQTQSFNELSRCEPGGNYIQNMTVVLRRSRMTHVTYNNFHKSLISCESKAEFQWALQVPDSSIFTFRFPRLHSRSMEFFLFCLEFVSSRLKLRSKPINRCSKRKFSIPAAHLHYLHNHWICNRCTSSWRTHRPIKRNHHSNWR